MRSPVLIMKEADTMMVVQKSDRKTKKPPDRQISVPNNSRGTGLPTMSAKEIKFAMTPATECCAASNC